MGFDNVYNDARRAEAYAKLESPGTYYLAYRDLPEIISEHIQGTRAIDFGCGTGRSTRFLRKLGFDVTGIDIAPDMIRKAVEADPEGDYRLVGEGDVGCLESGAWGLVLSAFTFDNIPTVEKKETNLGEIRRLLAPGGKMVNLVSSPDIYIHEWASFSTKDFPENRKAGSGDIVRIVMTDVEDPRPVEDILWTDDDYRELYLRSGLDVVIMLNPLAGDSEPYDWVNETRIAPWVVYVLRVKPERPP